MGFDVKTATPKTSFPSDGFLIGADSQSDTDPSIYPAEKVRETIIGAVGTIDNLQVNWNSSGTSYVGFGLNIDNDASASDSWIWRYQVNDVVMFGQRVDGALQFGVPFFALQIPDGTTAGGNARGDQAIDLQFGRTSQDQVASGQHSFAIGRNNRAYGDRAVAIGFGNEVGENAFAIGGSNSATGNGAFCMGGEGTSRGLFGARVFAAGAEAFRGDRQVREAFLRATTTNATPAVFSLGGHQLALPNDSTFLFTVEVVARRTDADGESAGYHFKGLIDRGTDASTTAFVGTVAKTVIAEDSSAWDVTVTADTSGGNLKVEVTGESGKTIIWFAYIRAVEIVG